MKIELLVIGSGLLGRKLAQASRNSLDTAFTYHTRPSDIEGCQAYQMDITRSVDLLSSLSPECVMLTAAMSNVDQCEIDQAGAWQTNAVGPRKVASAARKIGAKLIYISTDYVFDGKRGRYSEDDSVSPISYYGKSKLAGEAGVREILPQSAIARTSVLYGWNPARLNFVTWVIDELRKGNRINIAADLYASPTLADNLAHMLLAIRDQSGIFHAAGSERISRYDFASKIANAFHLDESLISPITSDQMHWKARRPKDSSLDVSKISRFAEPMDVNQGVELMLRQEAMQ
jgi:dTDP-4-dehydrorhamnose reductase